MVESLKSSTLTSYYTDRELVEAMLSPLSGLLPKGCRVLDPSCGNGAYFSPLRKVFDSPVITGVEKEGFVATLAAMVNRDVKVYKEGFENASLNFRAESFHLVTSNIPFGDYSIFDRDFSVSPDRRLKYSQNRIHNYYFAKASLLTAPGGFIAFITSTGVMDSRSSAFLREKLMEDCELVSAVRLPDTAFRDSSGTEINSDVVVLRKRKERVPDKEAWTEKERLFLETGNLPGFNHSVNALYLAEENRLLGTYEKGFLHNRETAVLRGGQSFGSVVEISEAVKTILSDDIKSSGYDRVKTVSESQGLLFEISEIGDLIRIPAEEADNYRLLPGSIFYRGTTAGVVQPGPDGFVLKPFSGNTLNGIPDLKGRVLGLVTVKTAYKNLIDASAAGDRNKAAGHREKMNAGYDSFVKSYGPFSDKHNALLLDNDFEGVVLRALERDGKKSEIFYADTFGAGPASVESVSDALLASLNEKGKADTAYMAALLGRPENEVISEGIRESIIYPRPVFPKNFNFVNPGNGDYAALTVEFVTRDVFLSGPVGYTLHWLENFGETHFPRDSEDLISKAVRELSEVVPPKLGIDLISPNLGEEWIRPKIFELFAEEIFDAPVRISKPASMSSWKVTMPARSVKADNAFRVTGISGRSLYAEDLLLNAMNNTYPVMKYSVEERMYVDKQATAVARDKIDEINSAFRGFLLRQHDISKELEEKYNALYNRNVKRSFDGSHLSFPGLDRSVFVPHGYQKDAVWQIVQNGGGICDHEVGSGKSLVIAMASMEMKRLGLCAKPMAIGLKANTQELYADFLRAYPHAKVLCPNENDFTPARRNMLIQSIANNNWDCVILTHDQFGFIRQSYEIKERIIMDEIRNIELDLRELVKEDKPSVRQLKGLEKRKLNLEASLKELQETMRKDENVLAFDLLGVDHLFVDESQQFKNLAFTSRHNRVAGLGDPEGSQKAMNLLVACRALQEKHREDRGITFLSGTTISNSVVEMYSLLKYLRPGKLEEMGLGNFDSWARTFAEMSTDFELNVVNEVSPKSRFRAFVKVPELSALYTEIAHVVNATNSTADKPSAKNFMVEIEPTPEQVRFTEDLVNAIKSDNFSFLGLHFTENQLNAKMLIATNYSAKSSLDMRLVSPDLYDISSGSKIPVLVENAMKEYDSSSAYRGTQLIFCDTGVPDTELAKNFVSVYGEIRNELIKAGVPVHEIAFIHDYKTGKKRKELFKKVNSGEVRFAIGSTTKMGVGVNMQERVIAMHHLDLCWRPSDMEQREGRGARQKNIFAKTERDNVVNNYVYCTARSLDGYKYYLLDLKRKFINQIKDGSVKVRRIEEGDISGEGEMSPAAFIARLSGKQEVLEKSRLEKKLASLSQRKDSILGEINRFTSIIERGSASILKKEDLLRDMLADRTERDLCFVHGENNSVRFSIDVDGKIYSDFKSAGEALIAKSRLILEKGGPEMTQMARCGNFILYGDIDRERENTGGLFREKNVLNCHVQRQGSSIKYNYGSSLGEIPGNAGRFIYDALAKIERLEKNMLSDIDSIRKEIKVAGEFLPGLDAGKHDEEIAGLKAKIKELEVKLSEDLEPKSAETGTVQEPKVGMEKKVVLNEVKQPVSNSKGLSV